MGKPKRPALNRARERRIAYEIVVDAYTPEGRAIGWHCHLDAKSLQVRKAVADWRYWKQMGWEF